MLAFFFMPTKNPKLNPHNKTSLFKYYAGFSMDFVENAIYKTLNENISSEDILVLDPWNGSGTTTNICGSLGIASIGIDRNPAMAIISKAREASEYDFSSLSTGLDEGKTRPSKKDPLLSWITPSGVGILRKIEQNILALTSNEAKSLGYVILFNTTKNLLKKYISSNPTWIKKPDPKNRIRLTLNSAKAELDTCINLIKHQKPHDDRTHKIPSIIVADSRAIPIQNQIIDLVITSPPYCTRIDYAVATSIELAVLAHDQEKFRLLRNELIGSTLIENGVSANCSWGKLCCETLERIRSHPSKASNGYYIKNFLRYFDSLYESIIEISRVTKLGGTCYIVIQDSYYKEIFIDLASITCDMFKINGWSLKEKTDFVSKRNKAHINTKSTKYQKNKIATESVLILRREK